MIIAGSYEYMIEKDYREAFKQEDFNNRYSDILSKYDYIVGDWGYGQLRLKGFYEDHNTKATFDTKIGTLQDYLYEFCNFGAAYFILKRGDKAQLPVEEEVTEVAEAPSDLESETVTEVVEKEATASQTIDMKQVEVEAVTEEVVTAEAK